MYLTTSVENLSEQSLTKYFAQYDLKFNKESCKSHNPRLRLSTANFRMAWIFH